MELSPSLQGVPAPPTLTRGQRFLGLNAARIGASIHIVVGHLHQMGALRGELRGVYFFSWGYTWVPWFFMLSGFVLTHARMRSTNPTRRENVAVFLQKRTAVIYPMYALCLLLALLVQWWRDRALPNWWVVLSQGLLVQSWVPWLPEQSLQLHCQHGQTPPSAVLEAVPAPPLGAPGGSGRLSTLRGRDLAVASPIMVSAARVSQLTSGPTHCV